MTTGPTTPAEDPAIDTDDEDPGHLIPADLWDQVVADAEQDGDR